MASGREGKARRAWTCGQQGKDGPMHRGHSSRPPGAPSKVLYSLGFVKELSTYPLIPPWHGAPSEKDPRHVHLGLTCDQHTRDTRTPW